MLITHIQCNNQENELYVTDDIPIVYCQSYIHIYL